MVKIERAVQKDWEATGAFEAHVDESRPKFFVTFPQGSSVILTHEMESV
jgi:leucyl-tRNA synthetase